MSSDRILRMPTGEVISIVSTGAETAGALFEFEGLVPPGVNGPPAHIHRVEQESFEVREGVLRVRLGSRHRDLGPGETVVVQPGTVHAFSNPTDRPTRIVVRETPAGQLEPQLRLLAVAGRRPPLLRLAALNVEHDLSFALQGLPAGPQRLMWRALAGLHHLKTRSFRGGGTS